MSEPDDAMSERWPPPPDAVARASFRIELWIRPPCFIEFAILHPEGPDDPLSWTDDAAPTWVYRGEGGIHAFEDGDTYDHGVAREHLRGLVNYMVRAFREGWAQ